MKELIRFDEETQRTFLKEVGLPRHWAEMAENNLALLVPR